MFYFSRPRSFQEAFKMNSYWNNSKVPIHADHFPRQVIFQTSFYRIIMAVVYFHEEKGSFVDLINPSLDTKRYLSLSEAVLLSVFIFYNLV